MKSTPLITVYGRSYGEMGGGEGWGGCNDKLVSSGVVVVIMGTAVVVIVGVVSDCGGCCYGSD